MNTLTRRLLIATAALSVAGASSLALARGGHEDGMGHGPGHMDSQQMAERMKDRMAKRLTDLKAKLKLTPEQEGAWTQFAAAMQGPAQGFKRPDPAEMAKLTTPERIDIMQALKAERDAAMSQRMQAVKTFYAALTPEQQKVFDAEHTLARPGGGHGHRW